MINHKGCSQNYGPFFVLDYIMAPIIQGYQNGTLILGTTLDECAMQVSPNHLIPYAIYKVSPEYLCYKVSPKYCYPAGLEKCFHVSDKGLDYKGRTYLVAHSQTRKTI